MGLVVGEGEVLEKIAKALPLVLHFAAIRWAAYDAMPSSSEQRFLQAHVKAAAAPRLLQNVTHDALLSGGALTARAKQLVAARAAG